LAQQFVLDEISHDLALPLSKPPAHADESGPEKGHYKGAPEDDVQRLLNLTVSKERRGDENQCDKGEKPKPDCHEDTRGRVHVESSVNASPGRKALERTVQEGSEGVAHAFRAFSEKSESVAADLREDRSPFGTRIEGKTEEVAK
jgi:hypothetical protein